MKYILVLLSILSTLLFSETINEPIMPKLKSLTLSAEKTHFIRKKDTFYKDYLPVSAPIKVMATYSDGNSEEVTDLVTWNKTSKRIRFYYDHFMALEGNFTVSASLNNVISNEIKIKVQNYNGYNPDDIVIHQNNKIKLIEPPLQQRRGAIRGVSIYFRVLSKKIDLKYELIDPPNGMMIVRRSDLGEDMIGIIDGVDILWDVPMDMEENIHTITMKATDFKGNKGQVNFLIKVPKTTIIPTKIVNNELIVIDKNSNLYGMKLKGHNGEDISNMQLRSVEYADVWKRKIKNKVPEDSVERTVFMIDNMPLELDVKFPDYIDSYEERRNLGLEFQKYSEPIFIGRDFWDEVSYEEYEYKGTKGFTIPYKRHGVYILEFQKL